MKMVTNLQYSKLTDTRATFPFKSIVEYIGEKIWNRNRLKNVILLQLLLEFSKRNQDIHLHKSDNFGEIPTCPRCSELNFH